MLDSPSAILFTNVVKDLCAQCWAVKGTWLMSFSESFTAQVA